jgi:hypothetical protein
LNEHSRYEQQRRVGLTGLKALAVELASKMPRSADAAIRARFALMMFRPSAMAKALPSSPTLMFGYLVCILVSPFCKGGAAEFVSSWFGRPTWPGYPRQCGAARPAPCRRGPSRAAPHCLWGTSSDLYFRVDKLLQQLANPNLHYIPRRTCLTAADGFALAFIHRAEATVRTRPRTIGAARVFRAPG